MGTVEQIRLFEGRDVWRRSEINQIMAALEMANDSYTEAFEVLRRALGIESSGEKIVTLTRIGRYE